MATGLKAAMATGLGAAMATGLEATMATGLQASLGMSECKGTLKNTKESHVNCF